MSNTEYEIPVEMLSALESGELGDFDRGVLAEELVKRLKETKSSLPEYGIYPDQFVFDGQLSIICGDRGQWEIILWSDGVVFGSYRSSFSMPAKPGRIERFRKITFAALSTSRIGMP